jgi:hypothetical protein
MSSDQNDILKEVRRIADALDRISASTVPPAMEHEHQAERD